jgi:threonine 3-dehydrogenase
MVRTLVKNEARPDGLALIDKQIAAPTEGEVQIRMLTSGICGTDLEIYQWPDWLSSRMRPPVVIGHEGCGVVEAVGQGVSHVRQGDLVALESHIHCETCFNCRTSKPHICLNLRYIGVDIDGVFAEHAVVPARIAIPVSPGISAELAALLEPFGIAVRAALTGRGVAGQSVLITGCGPIGLMTAIAASHLGARQIIMSEVAPYRLAFTRKHAKRMGIHYVVDATRENLPETVHKLTDGRGVNVWIDFTGIAVVLRDGLQAIMPGGEARFLASSFDLVPLDLNGFLMKEISIQSIHGRLLYQTWFESMQLMQASQETLKLLITHILPMDRYAEGFELLFSGQTMKVMFEINK